MPLIGEKRPRAGTRIRPNKQKEAIAQGEEASEENKSEEKAEEGNEVLVEEDEEEEEEVKESWDAESSSEEEAVEEPSAPAETIVDPVHPTSKSDSEETEDSSEEDDSDEDSDMDEEDRKKTEAYSRRQKALDRIQVCYLNYMSLCFLSTLFILRN